MRRATQRLAILVVLGSLVMSGAACSSTASKPSPSAPPAPQDLVSKRYGFRVTLTSAWAAVDAKADWHGDTLQELDAPELARFKDGTSGRTLVAAAAPVASGMRLVAWRAAVVRTLLYDCGKTLSARRTRLGDEPAMTWPAFCPNGLDLQTAATLHGHRGYVLLLASPTQAGVAADQSVFESIRRSFRFER
jgi:hypothetical protein